MTASHTLEITRTFDATPHEVFAAWTEPEQYARWVAPPPWSLGTCELDVRPGGRYKVETMSPDGQKVTFFGHYSEIVPDEKVVMVGGMLGPDGAPVFEQAGQIVTIREVEPGRTEQTLTNTDLPSAEMAEMFKQGCETSGLVDLERFLASNKTGA